jgi:NAD+--asparagine ADP-ribosyltransferase
MPLPFIPILGILGLFGIGKGVKTAKDNSEARKIASEAVEIYNSAKARLDESEKAMKIALEDLGGKKLDAISGSMAAFRDLGGWLGETSAGPEAGVESAAAS